MKFLAAVSMIAVFLLATGQEVAEPSKKLVNKEIEDLRSKVAELEKRVAALEEQLRLANGTKEPGQGPIALDVVAANRSDPQLTRHIRCKVVIGVDPSDAKAVDQLVRTKKAVLRNWLIAHLSEQSVADLAGAKAQAKLREDIRREFNNLLYPGQANGKIREISFDEFNVQ